MSTNGSINIASPELRQVIAMLAGRPPAESQTLEEYRAGLEGLTAGFPLPEGVKTEPAEAGGIPAEWVTVPESREDRILLYLHGGAYVRGSCASHRGLVARICRGAGIRALSINYRLAPEHPHPAALEDALAAYRWLLEGDAGSVGGAGGAEPARLAIAGDSAGGGLVLAALVALRDAGTPLPAAAVMLSPWTDLSASGESVQSRAAADPFLDEAYLHLMAGRYLAGADPATPTASPLFSPLHGLPPLLIQVGGAEILRDDSFRAAEKARAAGTEVTFEEWPEMVHVWHLFASMLPEGRKAVSAIGDWLRERMG